MNKKFTFSSFISVKALLLQGKLIKRPSGFQEIKKFSKMFKYFHTRKEFRVEYQSFNRATVVAYNTDPSQNETYTYNSTQDQVSKKDLSQNLPSNNPAPNTPPSPRSCLATQGKRTRYARVCSCLATQGKRTRFANHNDTAPIKTEPSKSQSFVPSRLPDSNTQGKPSPKASFSVPFNHGTTAQSSLFTITEIIDKEGVKKEVVILKEGTYDKLPRLQDVKMRAHNVLLDDAILFTYGAEILNVQKGAIYKQSDADPLIFNKTMQISRPSDFNALEAKRFFLQLKVADVFFPRPEQSKRMWLMDFPYFTCAAAIRRLRETKYHGQSIIADAAHFRNDPETFLRSFWKNDIKKPKITAVGTQVASASFFVQYPNENFIVRNLSDNQLSAYLQEYLDSVFLTDRPIEFTRKNIEKILKTIIIQELPTTKTEAEALGPVGRPFVNGCLRVELDTSTGVYKQKLDPLSTLRFTTDPSNCLYTEPTFKTVNGKNYINLSSEAQEFLKKLFRNNLAYASIGRAFMKAILLAAYEGTAYQSVLFIYGAGGAGKSACVQSMKAMLPEALSSSMLRTDSKFSASLLEGISLLSVDDLQTLGVKSAALLRSVVGRDPIQTDVKYEKDRKIKPCCATILVSNFNLEHFPELNGDAFKNKIITITLDKDYSIKPKDIVPNFELEIEKYLGEVYNWALYAPISLSQNIIRGEFWSNYNRADNAKREEQDRGFINFILDRMVMEPFNPQHKQEGFISGNSLLAAIEQYIEETGDGELEMIFNRFKNNSKSKLVCTKIKTLCANYFGYKECDYKRYPSTTWASRPWGLKNVSLVNLGVQYDKTRKMQPFVLSKKIPKAEKTTLPDWFESENCIKSVLTFNRD